MGCDCKEVEDRKGGQPPITLEVVELPKFAKNVLNSTPEVPRKFH
jgi:hypothetical protein